MKNINSIIRITRSIAFMAGLILVGACGGDESVSPQGKTMKLLTASTWKVSNVTVDGVDKTSVFTGLTIKFSETGYTSTNGKAEWPATGAWTFKGTSADVITRDDGTEITVSNLTSSSLTLTFTWTKTTFGGGRLQGIAGKNEFKFGI